MDKANETAVEHTLPWAIGIDLGGTKLRVARVSAAGKLIAEVTHATDVAGGPAAVLDQLVAAVAEIRRTEPMPPRGIGIGVAGQINEEEGVVLFAPNLAWHDVPMGAALRDRTGLTVSVINDVRAATWGEWRFGAGCGCDDIACLFVGTGIGGGVVSGGRLLTGCSNTAAEIGHITVALDGPPCHCPNSGCLETLAGGWGIAARAREAIVRDPAAGRALVAAAGGSVADVSARIVSETAAAGDPLAQQVMALAESALVAGAVNIVNAFNPCRLILGGGVLMGSPALMGVIAAGVRRRALAAAVVRLEVVSAQLANDAGVIGAASRLLYDVREKKECPSGSSSPLTL